MSEHFTLASWNIYQGLHFSSSPKNWRRNDHVLEQLRSLDSDVLVLPEAWKFREVGGTWAEELAAGLGYELHQWIGDGPSRARDIVPWRMVILTRIPVRRLPDYVFSPFGSFGHRGAVRIELVDSGLTVTGAHLLGIHLLIARQPRAWLAERREFKTLAESSDIIAGDMNVWGPVVSRDAPNHTRAVRGRTYPVPRPHSQIDHMLVNDRVQVIRSSVHPNLGSDHRAIQATLAARSSRTLPSG